MRGVARIYDGLYRVMSQSGKGFYHVKTNNQQWVCSCLDHEYRGNKCKHILAVELTHWLHEDNSEANN